MASSLGLVLAFFVAPGGFAVSGATLNARDFGAKGDGVTDDVPALNRALAEAIKQGPGTTLLIPSGTYALGQRTIALQPPPHRGFHLAIDHANGLTVTGEPGTVLLTRDLTQTFVHIENSQHVTLRSVTFDADPLSYTQGVVTAADPAARTVDLKVGKDYDDLDRTDFAATTDLRVLDNADGTAWKEDQYFPRIESRMRLGPGAWRVTLAKLYRYDASLVGKPWTLWAKAAYKGWAVHIGHSDDCLVDDVRIRAAGSGGFDFYLNDGNVTVRHAVIGPAPGSDRLFCAGGGAMSFFNRGLVTVEDCDFSQIDDDGFNLGTHFVRVVAKTGAKSCRTEAWQPAFKVGDTVVLWDWKNKTERGTAKVTSAQQEHDGHWQLQFDRPLEFVTMSEAQLDPSLSAGKKLLAASVDGIDRIIDLESAGSCILRRNKISSLRARCFLVKTGHSVIEDNLFHDTHMPGLLLGAEFFWGEGPELRGLIVRHNTFRNIDAPNISVATFDSPTGISNRDVTIEDNTFENYGRYPVVYMPHDPPGVAIQVRNTDGLTIRGNHIGAPPPGRPPINPIVVTTSRNVHVSP